MIQAFQPSQLPGLLGSLTFARLAESITLPPTYSNLPSEVLIRIHALPYLMPLHSERALAYELAERPELRAAVGLGNFDPPSRATLWHFRRRNQAEFRRVMRRALAVLIVEADRRLQLPYAHPTRYREPLNAVATEIFHDSVSGTKFTISHTESAVRKRRSADQIQLEFAGSSHDSPKASSVRALLHEELGFPIMVTIDGGATRLLVEPDWLNAPYRSRDLSPLLGRAGKEPYTACTLILLRSTAGSGSEILLSRRKWGSGAGTFAAPGGKKEMDETLRACAIRELREETGLIFRAGHPVSIAETREEGYPAVRSVGVLVTDWRGQPTNRDRAHSPWRWYPLSSLPTPLFFPTKAVLDHLRGGRFPTISWEEADLPLSPLPLWRDV